jgi:hypothetical protein
MASVAADQLTTEVASHVTNSKALSGAVSNLTNKEVVQLKKTNLMRVVQKDANRPHIEIQVESTVAMEGLREDYLSMCSDSMGGLLIVYDKKGMGKSHALQGVARAKSAQQPHRFLVINMQSSTMSCAKLYERIQIALGVQNLGLEPFEVAQVAQYGLLGPAEPHLKTKLPATDNSCRLSVNSLVPASKKPIDFPILVIDEFNPTDFDDKHWPDDGTDYSLQDLIKDDKMGESLKFFSELTGLAYLQSGFVVFVGTKSKAVTRALLKINGGTKAALAPSTKLLRSGRLFDAWQGFQWTHACKESLLVKKYKQRFQKALRENGKSEENAIQEQWNSAVVRACMQEPDIRAVCNTMKEELRGLEVDNDLLLQSRTQDAESGFCVDLVDQVKGAFTCAIM